MGLRLHRVSLHPTLHRSVGPGHDDRGRPGPALPLRLQDRDAQQKPSFWRRLCDLNAAFEGSWFGDLVGTVCLVVMCWQIWFLAWALSPVQP